MVWVGLVRSDLVLLPEVLDSPFPDDNLLTIKGLDIEHASVPT